MERVVVKHQVHVNQDPFAFALHRILDAQTHLVVLIIAQTFGDHLLVEQFVRGPLGACQSDDEVSAIGVELNEEALELKLTRTQNIFLLLIILRK